MDKKAQILGVIRHVLTFAGGYFVAQGWLDGATAELLVGAFVTIIGAVWSITAPEKLN